MMDSGTIWLLLVVFITSLSLIGLLSWMWIRFLKNQNQILINSHSTLMSQNRDLMNRMMSKDLPTYATMTTALTSSTSDGSPYISRDDVTEQQRLVQMGGFGAALYDEDLGNFHEGLAELGLYVDPNRE